MKQILGQLFEHQTLSKEEAKQILLEIGEAKYNNSQVASFLSVFLMRSITLQELEGFREAMLDMCLKMDLSAFDPMDLCGTGGDGKDTFNISTLATFVVAGAGVKVAKHGNYAVSSASGSSNVLEYLGYQFTNDVSKLEATLERAGLCFLHAPLFHPAMKNVSPIRKELGVKTFFNILGPMVNPVQPKKQLVGVFSQAMARLYAYLYQKLDKKFVILYALDGYDEISLTGSFKVYTDTMERIMTPQDLGLHQWKESDLYGGKTVQEAGKLFAQIIEGQGTPAQNEAVIANAAMAIHTAKGISIPEAVAMATESLKGKKALFAMKKLLEI